MIVKALNNEIDLTVASTVDNAAIVRVYADSGNSIVTNVSANTSFTIPDGAIVFVSKQPAEELTADVSCKAVSVASAIS